MFGSRRQYGDYDRYNHRDRNTQYHHSGYGRSRYDDGGYRRSRYDDRYRYSYGNRREQDSYGYNDLAFRPTLTSRILNGLTKLSQKVSKARKGKEMVQVDRLEYDDCIKQGEYREADCEVIQS